jgi:cytochrome c oxidase cbb3-type subunit II
MAPTRTTSTRTPMSELSAAAAAALGIPEAIVSRSAAARAEETGMTVDEVLAAWAGGGDIPSPAASAPVSSPEGDGGGSAEAAAEEESPPSPPPAVLPPSGGETPPSPAAPELPPAGREMPVPSGKPPVLVGEADNPIAVLVGAVGLFVALFLVGVVGPALPTENPGARTSDLPYSETALHGQEIYQSVGCASCHTQMVRPVVADVGLGAVSLNDTNQVLGTRRFGPDLSNVGARITASQIEAIITGLDDHPSLSLSSDDLDALVAYLVESATLEEAPPGEPADEEPAAEEPAPEDDASTEETTAS